MLLNKWAIKLASWPCLFNRLDNFGSGGICYGENVSESQALSLAVYDMFIIQRSYLSSIRQSRRNCNKIRIPRCSYT